jgi:hypothetical protein
MVVVMKKLVIIVTIVFTFTISNASFSIGAAFMSGISQVYYRDNWFDLTLPASLVFHTDVLSPIFLETKFDLYSTDLILLSEGIEKKYTPTAYFIPEAIIGTIIDIDSMNRLLPLIKYQYHNYYKGIEAEYNSVYAGCGYQVKFNTDNGIILLTPSFSAGYSSFGFCYNFNVKMDMVNKDNILMCPNIRVDINDEYVLYTVIVYFGYVF